MHVNIGAIGNGTVSHSLLVFDNVTATGNGAGVFGGAIYTSVGSGDDGDVLFSNVTIHGVLLNDNHAGCACSEVSGSLLLPVPVFFACVVHVAYVAYVAYVACAACAACVACFASARVACVSYRLHCMPKPRCVVSWMTSVG